MVHADQGPVSDHTGHADPAIGRRASDEILNCRGVEELDIGEREDLREESGGEERLSGSELGISNTRGIWDEFLETYSVLYNNKVSLIFIRHTKVGQKGICRLTHNHGAEQLATEPSPTTRSYACLDNGNFEVWARLPKHVSCTETTGPGTYDNNIRFGVRIKVLEVAASHSTRDLGLSNWGKFEVVVPIICHLFEASDSPVDLRNIEGCLGQDWRLGGVDKHSGRRRHYCRIETESRGPKSCQFSPSLGRESA